MLTLFLSSSFKSYRCFVTNIRDMRVQFGTLLADIGLINLPKTGEVIYLPHPKHLLHIHKVYMCLILPKHWKDSSSLGYSSIRFIIFVGLGRKKALRFIWLNLFVSYHSFQGEKRRILMSGFLTQLNLSICIHNNLKLLR